MKTDTQNLKALYDKSNMHDAILSFPTQIKQILDMMEDWNPQHSYSGINNILILGMGGSAIGGDCAKVISQNSCSIPILVNRSYNIPKWVNKSTLVLASSYSGNTEETLSAFHQCISVNAKVLVISTGGEITELANKNNLDVFKIPTGFQPRAALGFSFSSILMVLNKLNFIEDKLVNELSNSVELLSKYSSKFTSENEDNPAIEYADKISNSIPVIYGSEDMTWVIAYRFRCQLEENSKVLAFHHHIPEQNHNEIEGWNQYPDFLENISIIWLKDEDDHIRSLKRMNISKDILRDIPKQQIIIETKGKSRVTRFLKLIHFTDWISYYLALQNKIDPTPVMRIQDLKRKMNE